MYIHIYDLDNNLLDTSYIELFTIEEHVKLKLSNVALVYASKKVINNNNYFRYYNLQFYKLKSVDTFFSLIQQNIIKVSIVCRASYSKNEIGKQKNKGINFKISKKDVEQLFDKILEYDSDQKTILLNSEFIFKDMDILPLGDMFEKL